MVVTPGWSYGYTGGSNINFGGNVCVGINMDTFMMVVVVLL